MRPLLFSTLLLIACEKTIVLPGNEGPHGGDGVQVTFKTAQRSVVQKLRDLRSCYLRTGVENEIQEWIMSHRGDLISDIQSSQHEWRQNLGGSCARTDLARNSSIQFSYSSCQNVTPEEAFLILVHESVHHFGIESEDFPTEVATEIWQASNANCIPAADEILWLDKNISAWPATAQIQSVEVAANGICFDFTTAQNWPIKDMREFVSTGNYWVISNLEGVWYASTYEWIVPGLRCEDDNASTIADGTKKREFSREDYKWVPKSGELVGFMVSSMARFNETNGVQERSPIFWIRWP